jgi:hypothetical protein
MKAPEIAVVFAAHLICVQEVLVSNHGPETDYDVEIFQGYLKFSWQLT